MTTTDPRGLRQKYHVERLNDTAGKHEDCRYFVLDPQHDPIALEALRIYAGICLDDYPELAVDLFAWVDGLEGTDDNC